MTVTDQHPTDQDSTRDVHPTHGVDPNEEPSADWGWHGGFPVAGPIVGWFSAFALFMMIIGNRESVVPVGFLIGFGTILVVMLIRHHLKARKARRR
ncbi:MAG: DUF2631 domain-containing protein [Acidimicrobiales bacterium]